MPSILEILIGWYYVAICINLSLAVVAIFSADMRDAARVETRGELTLFVIFGILPLLSHATSLASIYLLITRGPLGQWFDKPVREEKSRHG